MTDFQRGWPEDWARGTGGPTIPRRAPYADHVPVRRDPAVARARRAFWRGTVFGGLVVGATFIAGEAWALSLAGTLITLEPSPDPVAVAVVTMANIAMNGSHHEGVYPLAMPGMAVEVQFRWDADAGGSDSITVTPPDGFACVPSDCTATVPEGQRGSVLIIEYVGF